MNITDEQARIIGREIGREIAAQVAESWYEFTNPVARTSLSDKIQNSIKEGFKVLATEIRILQTGRGK